MRTDDAALQPGPRTAMFFGKNMSRSRCTGGLVEALRDHGLQVSWHNMATLRRWLGQAGAEAWVRRAWRRLRPDLVFVFHRDLPRRLVEEFRAASAVVFWVEESLESATRSEIEYFGLGDLLCVSNAGRLGWLAAHGLDHAAFLMSGFSPTFHRPAASRPVQRQVAFIGGPGRKAERVGLLAEVSRRFDTEIFGRGWQPHRTAHPHLRLRRPIDNRGFARVCATSAVVLGSNQTNADRLYFSNRTWLTLGCRGFHVTHYVPGLEQVFDNGRHLVWYRGIDEALAQIGSWLGRDEERREVAAAGHALALREHRYFHRVGKILALLRGRDAGVPSSADRFDAPLSLTPACRG